MASVQFTYLADQFLEAANVPNSPNDVDAGELPNLVASDEVLARAVAVLGMRYYLHTEHLLQYAALHNTGPWWEALLATAA